MSFIELVLESYAVLSCTFAAALFWVMFKRGGVTVPNGHQTAIPLDQQLARQRRVEQDPVYIVYLQVDRDRPGG